MSVTDVVEESKTVITRHADIPLKLVTGEEKLIRVSLNIETHAIDTTDCLFSWISKAEVGLNMVEDKRWVEEHNLEETMHDACKVVECFAVDILINTE